ncbi:unnamed protein product [Durusdinium trenchii]|uniref:Uncharacterized protein n=1 Tax=Durusdinium trenchii TaxID=1381693 RepID=A0ABP0Q9G2_9DINO
MMQFAEGVSTAMMSGIGLALAFMIAMTGSALIYRSALGGKKDLLVFNLGVVPSSAKLAKRMKEMCLMLERMDTEDVSTALAALDVFDMNRVTTTITLLATEVAPPAEDAATYMFNPRINSSSFDPALAKSKQSLRSRQSPRLQELRHQAVGEEQEQSRPRSDEGLKSAWI